MIVNKQKDFQNIYHELLRSNGWHDTSQRRTIIKVILSLAEAHYSLDEITFAVKKTDPSIGQATVYRNLRTLEESGFLTARIGDDGVKRFEIVDNHHDHLICKKCQKIVEFCHPEIEKLQQKVAREKGFKVISHKLEIYGICHDCSK